MSYKCNWTASVVFILASAAALGQTSTNSPHTAVTNHQAVAQHQPIKTEQFGDWVMVCRKAEISHQSQPNCEIVQTIILNGQKNPFAQIAIGSVNTDGPLKVTVLLPNNVSFSSSVKITTDEKDKTPLDIIWTKCLQAGCFATTVMKEDIRKKWITLENQGRVAFKAGNGQDIIIPISFRGLKVAIETLQNQK